MNHGRRAASCKVTTLMDGFPRIDIGSMINEDLRVARGILCDQYLLWFSIYTRFNYMIHRPTSVGYPWEKDNE